MTKLERLCQRLDATNRGGDYDAYEVAKNELAYWVYLLWLRGRLDANNITMENRRGGNEEG